MNTERIEHDRFGDLTAEAHDEVDRMRVRLAPPINRSLAVLIDRLEAACDGPSDAINMAVTGGLGEAARDASLLSEEQRRGRSDRYVRHLLHADPAGRFSVVSLVWGPGQFSPVHGHYTWCGYVVVAGQLHEESYVWIPDRKVAIQTDATDRHRGDLCFSHAGLEEIHRLGNRGSDCAVSVHVYGIDGKRVTSHVNRVVKSV